MASLMELPVELLSRILEEVGGRELRRGHGAARLCVSRGWHAAARPVYLSGLDISEVKIYGYNLDELNQRYGYSGLRSLMHKNNRILRLRFLGHFWDENVAVAHDHGSSIESSETHNEPPFDFHLVENQIPMDSWRNGKLKLSLDELFTDLKNFSVLENLTFEASSDPGSDFQDGPHWDYIHQDSVLLLLKNLPVLQNLSSFTLDLCGMNTGLYNEQSDVHLCDSLATILPQIENVRVRMPRICPSVFRPSQILGSQVRLKSIILKLHLPSFEHSETFASQACDASNPNQQISRFNHDRLIKNSSSFLAKVARFRGGQSNSDHEVTGFRISFKDPSSPCVVTVDCLTMRYVVVEESFFCYEDDGTPCWFEFDYKGENEISSGTQVVDGPPYLGR